MTFDMTLASSYSAAYLAANGVRAVAASSVAASTIGTPRRWR